MHRALVICGMAFLRSPRLESVAESPSRTRSRIARCRATWGSRSWRSDRRSAGDRTLRHRSAHLRMDTRVRGHDRVHAGHTGARVLRDDRGDRTRGARDRGRYAGRGAAVGGVWALREVRGRRLRRLHEAQGDRRHARWRTGQAGQRSRGELRRCSSGRRCGHRRTDGADDRQRGSREDGGHQEGRSCPRPGPWQHRTGCRAVRAGGRRRSGGDCR